MPATDPVSARLQGGRAVDLIHAGAAPPVVLAYGIGVDSTALLIELEARGEAPDRVLTGDPGVEKPENLRVSKVDGRLDASKKHPLRKRALHAKALQALAALIPLCARR